MSSSSQLISRPLQSDSVFNFVYLIEWITIGILTLWFLFYFNRVLATIISYALRLYSWHRLGIYVDIEALQISLLAGRIFFKGVHYHGDNETIHIHGGYITWRYWLRKTKQPNILLDSGHSNTTIPPGTASDPGHASTSTPGLEPPGRHPAPNNELPCRIEIKVSGVEAFIYNRGPGYDFILQNIEKHQAHMDSHQPPSSQQQKQQEQNPTPRPRAKSQATDDSATLSAQPSPDALFAGKSQPVRSSSPQTPVAPPSFLRLLPIRVECTKAAAVLGNENTPSIITAKIDSAAGEFDAGAAGHLDIFKILMSFDAQKPFIQMKPNIDYKRPQLAEAAILKQTGNPTGQVAKSKSPFSRRVGGGPLRLNFGWARYVGLSKRASASLESVVNLAKLSTTEEKLPDATQDQLPGQGRWLGLTRYLEDEQKDERNEWDGVEYAKSSTLAELESVTFKMFWDIPGPKPAENFDIESPVRDINGAEPPEYGMEIVVFGGTVVYGPWADRHRLILQQIFFPASYVDSHPTPRVKPGELRINSSFHLLLHIEGDTILRIPFKEPSRDWKWKGRAEAVSGKGVHREETAKNRSRKRTRHARAEQSGKSTDARPYAWFDMKVLADSTISYNMDVYPYPDGFRNELSVDVKGLEMYSSLNHALLWRSQGVTLKCSLPYTLAWNGLREWIFEIGIKNLDFFLLRDHTFLLVDLIEDWTTGPPPAFFTFVAYRYFLKTHLDNMRLFLNVNDANIVDSSDDLEDNDFVILYGRSLDADLTIPLDKYRPTGSEILFDVAARDLGFELSMPPKNTLNSLLANKDVAQLTRVILKGSYCMNTDVGPGLTETLRMEIVGTGLRVAFYGFFARHLAKIKENYFGDTVHFRTNEEFQDLLAEPGVDPHGIVQNSTKSNELDVILDIVAEDAVVMLPAGLYSCDDFLDLRIERADVDLRVNSYYLEMAVDSAPLRIGHNSQTKPDRGFDAARTPPDIVIDGVNVSGHRLFGLSPAEPAYVSNWDIDAGDILGDMSCEFLSKAVLAAQAIALTLTDEENGLPLPDLDTIYDMTAVRFQCSLVRLWLRVANVAFLMNVSNAAGTFNDRNTTLFSQRLDISVPDIHIACTENDLMARGKRLVERPVKEAHAFFQTSVSLQMLQRAPNFEQTRKLQQEHIAKHDVKGRRAQFLLPRHLQTRRSDFLSLCAPKLPSPLERSSTTNVWTQEHKVAKPSMADSNRASHWSAMQEYREPFASGSVYEKPILPLDAIKIDLEEVPVIPSGKAAPTSAAQLGDAGSMFNGNLDDDAVHTSLIIDTSPGIVAMCKPRAVVAVADILDSIVAKSPEAIFDQYQTSVVQEVIALLTRKRGKRTILDISLKVPFFHLRIINPFSDQVSGHGQVVGDEYNLACSEISTMIRVKQTPDQTRDYGFKAVHLTASAISVYALKRIQSQEKPPMAFRTTLDDLLVWVADSDRTSIRATFRALQVHFSGQDVQYLASLVHRTTMLVDGLQTPYATLAVKNDLRRRYLIYHLTRHSEDVPDPSFLTRPSYMIRSAKDHLRNSDSWKIVARLRWVMLSLPDDQRIMLREHCCQDELNLPSDAEVSILAALDRWRSWDAIHVKDSIAMRLLFNAGVGAAKLHDRSSIPVAIVLQASSIAVRIDHGKKQNELVLDGMAFALTITPPPPPSAMQIFHDYQEVKILAVQINTSKAALNLKWEVCELADSIMTLFREEQPGQQSKEVVADAANEQPRLREDGTKREEFHIVFAADNADINVETPNISQQFASRGLKASVTGQQGLERAKTLSINNVASAQEASMTMSRGSKTLWRSGISQPAMFIAYEPSLEEEQIIHHIQVAADCTELHLDLKEDMLGMLETIDLVVNNEARYLKRMAERNHQFTSPNDPLSPPGVVVNNVVEVKAALFLTHYYFRFSLHPALHYLAEGRVARMTVNPDVETTVKYSLNFDLKSQSHHFLTGRIDKPDTTSTLELPAINGTIGLSVNAQEIDASARLAMESIKFDGAAIYGIAAALTLPAATSAFESIKGDFETIMTSVQDVFSEAAKKQKATPPKTSKTVSFDATFVLAGFAIAARAPPRSHGRPSSSSVYLTLAPTRFKSSNRSQDGSLVLPFPELSLTLGDIDVLVQRDKTTVGRLNFALRLACTMTHTSDHNWSQRFELAAAGPVIVIDAKTAPTIVDILAHFQDRLRGLDLSRERRYFQRLRRPRDIEASQRITRSAEEQVESSFASDRIATSFALNIQGIQVTYEVEKQKLAHQKISPSDLVLTLATVKLVASSEREARLQISDLQLQLVRSNTLKTVRSANSALMPELIFNVAYEDRPGGRHLAFRAAGKVLDLQIDPNIVQPIGALKTSLVLCVDETRRAVRHLKAAPSEAAQPAKALSLGTYRITYVLVNTNFAGAEIKLRGANDANRDGDMRTRNGRGKAHEGRFGQFMSDSSDTSATLRAPGIALRLRYEDLKADESSSLSVELRVNGSNNTLTPSVVPLILQIFHNVKETMQESDRLEEVSASRPSTPVEQRPSQSGPQLLIGEGALVQSDPHAVLGRMKLNFGLRICRQEFSMTCQPIAKVAAKAKLEDMYIAVNTVESGDHGNFFTVSVAITGLQAALQHVYSRDATFVFDMSSVVLSMMNSKHISGTTGISAILRIDPTKASVNAKQLQDMLLFREIWFPPEIRHSAASYQAAESVDPQDYFVKRYRQIAASTAFPWNATVAVTDLSVEVDLGQAIGKLSSRISNLWASSKKTTSSQQTLCFGVDNISIDSAGRTSGFVQLSKVKVRSSIAWPSERDLSAAPIVQGSVGFHELRLKAAFDYQTFAIAHITNFEFIMYNVRDSEHCGADRLVAILDGDMIHVYCVAASAALAVSLVQALDRLVQEKRASYDQSLKDIESFLRRKSAIVPKVESHKTTRAEGAEASKHQQSSKMPISLQTDVVVTLGSVNVGAFPRTIVDTQLLKLEASNVQARFAVALDEDQIHSGLGLTLGQVSAALGSAPQTSVPSALQDITVEQVVRSAGVAKGGVILRVPRVVAAMQTWQAAEAKTIDYTFRSTFEGKIDVGWNLSRISFIRSMWETHCRTLGSRLGRPLPESALKITGPPPVPGPRHPQPEAKANDEQGKITAVVNLPQSKYSYRALEPPVIDTPQLRDMGEATPPLEWIGLHRDRLPNVTHQVVIVTLLEIAKEVEDAYLRILGSSG